MAGSGSMTTKQSIGSMHRTCSPGEVKMWNMVAKGSVTQLDSVGTF